MTYALKPILDKGFVNKDLHFIVWLPVMIIAIFLVRGVVSLLSNYFVSLLRIRSAS